MGRVFANGPVDRGLIPGRVIPKTQKMVFVVPFLNIQHYKVGIKGKWCNPGNLQYIGLVAIGKRAFGYPSTPLANFTYMSCSDIYTEIMVVGWLDFMAY